MQNVWYFLEVKEIAEKNPTGSESITFSFTLQIFEKLDILFEKIASEHEFLIPMVAKDETKAGSV